MQTRGRSFTRLQFLHGKRFFGVYRRGIRKMAGSSVRYWLGFATLLALAVLGYALVRSSPSVATLPPKPVQGDPLSVRSASSESGPGEWAMEGYNPARTRALSESIALPMNRQQEVRITEDRGIGSPVAIAQNVILVEAEHYLRAIDLETGEERWAFAEKGRYISPAVAGDTVFIRAEANNQGEILAVDLHTGQQRWAFTPRRLSSPATDFWGGHLTSPVIAGGTVFIGAGKEIYALDAATGAVRWEYTTQDYIFSSATVGDQRVFISDATHLYALDQETGKVAWKTPTDFAVYFSPIVANQTVFLTNGEKLLALNTVDGAKRWETGIPGLTLIPGAAQGSRLFVKSMSTLYALDLATGDELWHFDDPSYVSFPAIAGDQLFAVTGASGQTGLVALDVATGQSIWNQPVPVLTTAAPVIAGQTVYVRTTDGRVLGLSN